MYIARNIIMYFLECVEKPNVHVFGGKAIPTCIPVSGPPPASFFVGLRIWETVLQLYGAPFVSKLIFV